MRKRCNHDGGTCHHQCDTGQCFRLDTHCALSKPWDGFPKNGKYEAKVESVRTVDIEWSGAIFDTPEQARAWARKIKASRVADGVDPAAIRIEVSSVHSLTQETKP